jgi:hypothetical protein
MSRDSGTTAVRQSCGSGTIFQQITQNSHTTPTKQAHDSTQQPHDCHTTVADFSFSYKYGQLVQ